MTEMMKPHRISGETLGKFLRFCAEHDIEDGELNRMMDDEEKLPLLLARIRCKAGLPNEVENRLRKAV